MTSISYISYVHAKVSPAKRLDAMYSRMPGPPYISTSINNFSLKRSLGGPLFGLVIILILVHNDHNQIQLVKSLKQRIDFDENVAKYKSLQVKK